ICRKTTCHPTPIVVGKNIDLLLISTTDMMSDPQVIGNTLFPYTRDNALCYGRSCIFLVRVNQHEKPLEPSLQPTGRPEAPTHGNRSRLPPRLPPPPDIDISGSKQSTSRPL
ncbi:unnamed protein product, partial [Ectocarpus sp. 4 AP-2014]